MQLQRDSVPRGRRRWKEPGLAPWRSEHTRVPGVPARGPSPLGGQQLRSGIQCGARPGCAQLLPSAPSLPAPIRSPLLSFHHTPRPVSVSPTSLHPSTPSHPSGCSLIFCCSSAPLSSLQCSSLIDFTSILLYLHPTPHPPPNPFFLLSPAAPHPS